MATKKDPPVDGYPVGKRGKNPVDAGKGRLIGQDVPGDVRKKAGYPDKGK